MTEQPPSERDEAEKSTTGLDPNVAAMLSYLAWWLTGILFYVLERDSPYVRFHAMQSIVAFGALTAAGLLLLVGGLVMLFISPTGFQVLTTLAELVFLAGFVIWIICLIKSFNGERWKLPVAGDVAERIAESR